MSLSLNPSESRTVDGIYNVLAIAFVFFAVALESQSMADGPQDRDALEKYLQSVEQISSFDIVYSIRTKHLYELKAGASPTSLNALQPLAEGEVPHEDVEAHRLVYKLPLGKRRVEELSPSYEPVAIGTYDGELVRSMRYQTALGPSGSIRGSSLQFLPERSDYLCYYRNAFTELPWKVLYTERKSVCRVFEENGYTVVELPPVEGKVGLSVSTLLVRAFLDKQTNQLRHYDVFDKRADGTWHLQQRVEIKEVLQLEGGARAVTAAVASRYFPADTAYEGQLMQVMELAVDNSRSKWNIPIDEDLFVLRYPEGVTRTEVLTTVGTRFKTRGAEFRVAAFATRGALATRSVFAGRTLVTTLVADLNLAPLARVRMPFVNGGVTVLATYALPLGQGDIRAAGVVGPQDARDEQIEIQQATVLK